MSIHAKISGSVTHSPDVDEHEAAFYFMLHDFEYWIKKDGVKFVMERIDPDLVRKIKAYLNDN